MRALIQYSRSLGYEPELLEAVESVNEGQPQRAIELCKELVGELKGKRVAVLGLEVDPMTRELRKSRAILAL